MSKIYQFTQKDKSGAIKNVGKMEIKNKDDNTAELFIYGDIVSSNWYKWDDEDTCPQDVADFLNSLDDAKNIRIYINSGGGDVFGGLAIYNMLKRHPANKTVYVDGLAASIASVIALAGNVVVIPKTAQFMVHRAWVFMWGGYNSLELIKLGNDMDRIDQTILNVYAENLKPGVKIDTIKQMVDDETWMTGEEAEKYFNIQVEETLQAAACAESQFFSRYKNVPRNLLIAENKKANESPANNAELEKTIDEVVKRLENLENSIITKQKVQNEEKTKQAKAKLALALAL